MIDAQLFSKALKFAVHAAAKRDARYYLVGARLEFLGSKLTICGTDGARLALVTLTLDRALPNDAALTIGTDDVKRILTAIGKAKGAVAFRVEPASQPAATPTLFVDAAGVVLQAKGLDGTYPDMRRIIPAHGRVQGPMPNLQACFLADASSALEQLAGDIKGVKSISFDIGQKGEVAVLRPTAIHEHRIAELMVLISPTRA